MNLTPKQLETLRHMLGINNPRSMGRQPKPYRDYYCANRDDPCLVILASLGAVELYSRRDGYDWYRTTPAGRAAAIASYRSVRPSPGQARYLRWLDFREINQDLTFREFLTDPQYAAVRRECA